MDPKWDSLVEGVLLGVEPDGVSRGFLRERLAGSGVLSMLYCEWKCGMGDAGISTQLRRLALREMA